MGAAMFVSVFLSLLIAFEAIQLLFLLAHDWVQVGTLNDVAAQKREDPFAKRVVVTLVSAAPFAFLLRGTLQAWTGHAISAPLLFWLAFGYSLLFAGELASWWFPYLFGTSEENRQRFKRLFGNTHSFLRERKGMRPNTLHTTLHVTTVATLFCVAALAARHSL